MSEQRLILPDLWQQTALRALRAGKDVIVQAPTGSGKTHVFELFIKGGHQGQAVYTVPTRALANDKRAEWSELGWDVGIATGDISENLNAPIIVATLETQRQKFLENKGPDLLVIDEYQMLTDNRRGAAYETVLALAPKTTQLLLLSGSVANPKSIVEWLSSLGRDVTLVEEHRRPVPLEEIWLDALETKEPEGVRSSIARAVIKGLQSDLGPILVFAPRRKAAEQIAKDIAYALPLGNGPQLTAEQKKLAGDDLYKLLRQGVGLHHSGLTYQQRSELIEPWAKSGKLDVVVATTGLAAGINFSLRSVLVTDRKYITEHAEQEIRPDELLQMFGRAGRRGLDEKGYAVWSGDSPRLGEAKPLQIKRSKGLDWPAILTVMRHSDKPKESAQKFVQSLFTRETIELGLTHLSEIETAPSEELPGTIRRVEEMLGRNGIWQRIRPSKVVPMSEALIRIKGEWYPALSKPDSLKAVTYGTPCKIRQENDVTFYGRIVPLAHFPKTKETDGLTPVEWLRKALQKWAGKKPQTKIWTLEQIEKEILPLLPQLTQGGRPIDGIQIQRETVMVKLDYSSAQVRVIPDAQEENLINPDRRFTEKEDINLKNVLGTNQSQLFTAQSGKLWLKLKLIQADGTPTVRGRIASLFQHGEGLAVAAALEDEAYNVEDLCWDLAELRAGDRLGAVARNSSRLGACCRLTYKSLTAEGYLHDGLPDGFGEGCAELLKDFVLHNKIIQATEPDGRGPGRGDLERALLEWRSTLRLISNCESGFSERWDQLQKSAKLVLAQISPEHS
jgi:superfamily II DNA/RNA helicase